MTGRPYDGTNPQDRAWWSRVYQAAMVFIPEFLRENNGRATLEGIRTAFKAQPQHSQLCDDSIWRAANIRSPKWKHGIDSALNVLHKKHIIQHPADKTWALGSAVIARPPPPPSPAPVKTDGRKGDALVVPFHVHSLEEILEAQQSKFRADLLDWLKRLSPYDFQKFCKYLLEALGCSDVTVNPPGPDKGVDGDAKQRAGEIETVVKFQAKRWDRNVGRPDVDAFRGAIQGKCHEGVVLTTSDFTADAQQAAVRMGAVPIHLINGQRIVDLMIEKKIGVRDYPVIVLQRDPTFLA